MCQPFADAEVHRVVDGGLGPQRSSFLVVLLDLGVLVLHVQAWGDPVGDDPGGERARGAVLAAPQDDAVEDQGDPVGSARSRLSRITWSKKIRPDRGRSSIWVRENSACKIEVSYR